MTQTTDNAGLTFTLRPAAQRGQANFGWLQSAHSFSFGQYYDPAHMGFGNLRVINDDQVAGWGGDFPTPTPKCRDIFLCHQRCVGTSRQYGKWISG